MNAVAVRAESDDFRPWVRVTPPARIPWGVSYLPKGTPWGGVNFIVRATDRNEAIAAAENELRYFYAEVPDHFRPVSVTPFTDRRHIRPTTQPSER